MNCKNCEKEINKNKIFCNQLCRDEYNKNNKYVTTNCDYCGNQYKIEKRFYKRLEQGKNKTKCCSKECHNKLISKNKEKNGVIKNCLFCNKEFYVKPYLVSKKEYCSQECLSKSGKINFICEICGKEATTNKYQYNKYKKHFCSKKCKDYYMHKVYPDTEEGKTHIKKIALKGYKKQLKSMRYTKPELIVMNYLKDNNINFEAQKFLHNKFFVDIYLSDYDIVIEVFGDYWHGNPKYYNKDNLNISQQKQKNKDKSRIAYLSKTHNKLIILWEDDILNNNFIKQLKENIN